MNRLELQGAIQYVKDRGFSIVALQFPDDLLAQSHAIYDDFSRALKATNASVQVYLLADVTFNALAVDEVAAAHVGAQCIVHFGQASFSPVSRVPTYFVLPRLPLNLTSLLRAVRSAWSSARRSGATHLVVLLDLAYTHARDSICAALNDEELPVIVSADPCRHLEPEGAACCHGDKAGADERPENTECDPGCDKDALRGTWRDGRPLHESGKVNMEDSAAGRSGPRGTAYRFGPVAWDEPDSANCAYQWVGPHEGSAALQHLLMTHSDRVWNFYDPCSETLAEGAPSELSRRLMRRYYLVERTRNAQIIGILVSTLSMRGYRAAVDVLRRLADRAGKKAYTFLMGKPSPSKLANFPEVEIFVQVADPHDLLLDCKDFFAPVVTPYEAHLALTGGEWDPRRYSMDLTCLLAADALRNRAATEVPRYSPLDGAYHGDVEDVSDGTEKRVVLHDAQQLALRTERALHLSRTASERDKALAQPASGADFLMWKRTYQGLDHALTGAVKKEPHAAVQGRSGRAAGYTSERSAGGAV